MKAHRGGDFIEAIRLQSAEVERQIRRGSDAVDSRKLLSLYHYSAGQHENALTVLNEVRKAAPEEVEVLENIGVVQRNLGRIDEAVESLMEAHHRDPERFNVCDALAHCFANQGDSKNSQHFGRLSLELKDQMAAKKPALRRVPAERPPAFSEEAGARNVISFSLWGTNPRYLKGAVRNAQAALDIYPGWSCRFYCDDSVPADIISALRHFDAEVVMRPRPASFFDGLLWRFDVFDDPSVSRFLIRDCDSVVNVQERVAVDEWLKSDRWFHGMRDFASHTEVILAGMWGGVSGVLPSLKEVREAFRPETAPTKTFDQVLLRECVWPVVRQSVLIHDSVYTGCLGSVAFPALGALPSRFHVGQNEAAVRPDAPIDVPSVVESSSPTIFVLSGLDEEAVYFCQDALDAVAGVNCPPEGNLKELRAQAKHFVEGCHAAEPDPRLRDEVLAASVRSTAKRAFLNGAEHVGIVDTEGDLEILSEMGPQEDCKLLYVLRDPRDTASARRVSDVEECLRLARDWVAVLRRLAKVNQARPGTVEIVRYEDLAADKQVETLARIARFVGVAEINVLAGPGKPVDSGKPLPDEFRKVIETEAGDYLSKLQYSQT